MQSCHRTALRKSLTCTIRHLAEKPADMFDAVLDDLASNELLTFSMREEIDAEKTATKRARALMTILPKRGPTCYATFIISLQRHGYDELVNQIRQYEIDDVVAPPTRPPPSACAMTIMPSQEPFQEQSGQVFHQQPSPVLLSAQRNDADENNLCPICEDRDKEMALVPCGHVFCGNCTVRFGGLCPNCRTPTTGSMRIFL